MIKQRISKKPARGYQLKQMKSIYTDCGLVVYSVVINIRAYVPGVRGTPQLARWRRVAAAVFHYCYCSVQIIHTSRIVSAVLLCNSGVTRVTVEQSKHCPAAGPWLQPPPSLQISADSFTIYLPVTSFVWSLFGQLELNPTLM